MKKTTILLMILGILVPSIIFCQKNRISIYTGLFHEYFDGSPMLNVNFHSEESGFLKNRLYNSYGIEYSRKINEKSRISIEANYLYNIWSYMLPQAQKNVVSDRHYLTFNSSYERVLPLSKKVNFNYGGGITYRNGYDLIVLWYHYFNFSKNNIEAYTLTRSINDIGINLNTGIEYTPLKWLTLYTKFNFIGFVYFDHRETINKLQDVYGYKKYPHPFDLSWRFGVGFNFGK